MGGFQGQASDIEIQAKEILRMKDRLNRILMDHSGKKLEDIQKDTDRDFFMSGEEAKKYGIVDHVIANRDDLDHLEESES
jgi:ATP-dependent Clp protease protease subunit